MEALPGKVNFLLGSDPANWQRNLPTFARVRYRNVYPGINAVFYGNQRQLEYDFVVAPGADPRQIKLAVDGTKPLRVDGRGDLILPLAGGDLRQHKPVVYQQSNGDRQLIAARYMLTDKNEVGIEIGDYDRARELVIDPVLTYSGYLGGSGDDRATSVAVDKEGNVYVTGSTASADFATANARQSALAGSTDIFVAKLKLNADGTAMALYSTYIGGRDEDRGNSIALDGTGNVYVAGVTTSTNFPIANGVQPAFGSSAVFSSADAAANWSPRGNGLSATTVTALVMDPDTPNTIYAATAGSGIFKSADGGGVWQLANGDPKAAMPKLLGSNDARALAIAAGKLYAGTSRGVFSSTDGGATWNAPQLQLATDAPTRAINQARENVRGLAIDPANSATVYAGTVGGVFKSTDSGLTSSPINTGLPNLDLTTGLSATTVQALAIANSTTLYAGTTNGVFKSTDSGGNWAAKNTGLTDTRIQALVIDPQNAATLFAGTPSGVFKSTNGGDAWAANNAGLTSTAIRALAIDAGSVYAVTPATIFKSTDGGANWTSNNTGQTNTDMRALTVKGATLYLGASGGSDAVMFKLSGDGGGLLYSTYLGGGATDGGNGLAVNNAGNVFVTGGTTSTNFPLQAPLANQLNGGSDAFIAKINTAATGRASLVYSTFLGGSGGDQGNGIAIDADDNAYVTGATASPNFPASDKALQKKYGNNAAFKSADGGANWTASGSGITGEIVTALAAGGAAVFAGNGNGVFKSTDGGGVWTAKTNGLGNSDVRALGLDSAGAIYAGAAGGVFKSADGGESWSAANTGLGNLSVRTLAVDGRTLPAKLYAGTNGGGLFKSTNGGMSWTLANGPKDNAPTAPCLGCLPTTNAASGESSATVAAIALGDANTILVGIGSSIFKSADGGGTWNASSSGLPASSAIQALLVDPAALNTVYAGTTAGLFKSVDGGATWVASSNGLASNDVRALAKTATAVYAGTAAGVFKSANGGANWTASNTGLTSTAISALAIDPAASDTLYAGIGAGSGDVFLAKLSAAGNQLLYATYLGGGDSDAGNGIALGPNNSIYLTGATSSTNFPTTGNAPNKNYGGKGDAFVAIVGAVSATGEAALTYSTFLGGGGPEQGNGIAVDGTGRAYVTGSTASADFPAVDAINSALNGAADAFVSLLDTSSNGAGGVVFSTFLGGSGSDAGLSIALDMDGAAYVAGSTASANFPISANALDMNCCGMQNGARDNGDGFIARIATLLQPADLSITKTAAGGFRVGEQATYTITVSNAGPGAAAPPLRVLDPLPAELTFESFAGTDWTCSAEGQLVTCLSPKALAANASTTLTLTVTINAQPKPAQPGDPAPPLVNTATVSSLTSDPAGNNNTVSSAGKMVDPPCSFTISPTSQSFTAAEGAGLIGVTTQAGCAWQAMVTSGADFITIEGVASGNTGSGAVAFRVAANPSLNSRSGALTVAGQTFSVTQSGIACVYGIAPDVQAFDANGGSGSVTITATMGCPWQAVSDAPGFVALTSAGSGSGNGAVRYNVTANPGAGQRAGSLTVTGRNFTQRVNILQGSKTETVCAFTLRPANDAFAARGGDRAFFVDVSPDSCEWTATSNSDFVIVTSDAAQSGSAFITYLLPPNLKDTARSGTITIAQTIGATSVPRETFTVTQDAQRPPPSAECSYRLTIPPASQNFAAGEGDGMIAVTAGDGCPWQAAISLGGDFISIDSGSRGLGSGTVKFRIAANGGALARSGILTIAGQTVFVRQAGTQSGTTCVLTIDPGSAAFAAQGGDSALFVNSSLDTCEWTATTTAAFIHLTSDRDQSGGAYITFVVDPNVAATARSGTILIADRGGTTMQTFTITQPGAIPTSILRSRAGNSRPGAQPVISPKPAARRSRTRQQ